MTTAPTNFTIWQRPDGRIQCDWIGSVDAVDYMLYETNSTDGVWNNPQTHSDSTRGPFNETRTFEYWVKARDKAGILSQESNHARLAYKPTAPIPPKPAPSLWACDLTRSSITDMGFESTPWNRQGSGEIGKGGPSWPPAIATAPDGVKCVKYQLPPNNARIELEPKQSINRFSNEDNKFFGFHFYLDKDYPLDLETWQVIWQLHGDDTLSPQYALEAHKNALTIKDNDVIAKLVREHRYFVVVHVDFKNENMSVWLDGQKVATDHKPGRSSDPYYLKFGYYRDPKINSTGTIWAGGYRLGGSYEAAYPRS